MKKSISIFTALTVFVLTSIAQTSDWSKDDRNNIFSDCMSYTTKYKSTSEEQRESLCLCYLDELTKKYGKSEWQSKIEIEVKRTRDATITQCAKNNGLVLSDQSEVKKEEPKKEEPKNDNSATTPTKQSLTGHWKDENSEFWLFETGDYKMQYTDGKTAKGTWKIDGDQLNLYKDQLFGTSEKVFKILIFTNEKFVYQSLKNKKDTFTATRTK